MRSEEFRRLILGCRERLIVLTGKSEDLVAVWPRRDSLMQPDAHVDFCLSPCVRRRSLFRLKFLSRPCRAAMLPARLDLYLCICRGCFLSESILELLPNSGRMLLKLMISQGSGIAQTSVPVMIVAVTAARQTTAVSRSDTPSSASLDPYNRSPVCPDRDPR